MLREIHSPREKSIVPFSGLTKTFIPDLLTGPGVLFSVVVFGANFLFPGVDGSIFCLRNYLF